MVAADLSTDGVAVLGNTLELNGGTIRGEPPGPADNARLSHDGLRHNTDHKVVTPGSAAPILQGASVSGTSLTLTFSETLGAAASLANGAFTVKKTPQDGTEGTVSLSGSPAISGATVTLTLGSAVAATDTGVKVSYAKPASGTNNKLVDAGGTEAADFSDEWVVNTLDTTKPRLVRGEIDGDTITLQFSEPLDEDTGGRGDYYLINLPWSTDFGDAPDHGRCRSGSGWARFTTRPRDVIVSGSTVVVVGLNEDDRYRAGVGQYTPNFYYVADITTAADQRLRDLSGNPVSTPDPRTSMYWYTQHIYLDNVTQLPSPDSATVNGNRLTLTFDAPMDGNSRPATSAFTVKVNGSAVNLSGVNISGRDVTLTLSSAVAAGNSVTVSYTKPTSQPLQNVICEDAPGFTDEPVTNLN